MSSQETVNSVTDSWPISPQTVVATWTDSTWAGIVQTELVKVSPSFVGARVTEVEGGPEVEDEEGEQETDVSNVAVLLLLFLLVLLLLLLPLSTNLWGIELDPTWNNVTF